MVREWLERRIRELLVASPGMSARELAAAIDRPGVTKTEINKVLHARQEKFVKTDDTPPRWSVRTATGEQPPASPPQAPAAPVAAPPPLGLWQRQALVAWGEHGHRGVVVAVDGAGKTGLGVAAAAEALDAGHPVLIVVPDADDQRRWTAALRAGMPARDIVAPGRGTATHGEITVVTGHAAIQDRMFDKRADDQPTALIVDDVHAYSAGAYAKALLPRFAWRLGLTCGLPRPDDLVDTVVLPYFEHTLPGCDYLHAVQACLLPRINLAHLPLALTDRERANLEAAEDRAEQALDTLVGTYGAPGDPAGAAEFARAALHTRGRAGVFAKRYLDAIAKRDDILGSCAAKITLLQALPVDVLRRTRACYFTDTAAAANRAVQLLGRGGYRITRVGESLAPADRADIARRLGEGDLDAVVERRALDTTVPLPATGAGIFLACDLSAPELAQRLSRVIRPGGDHLPVVVLAYAEGTVEDPRRVGPHLRQLAQIAEEFVVTDARGLDGLLRRWIPGTEPRPTAAGREADPVAVAATVAAAPEAARAIPVDPAPEPTASRAPAPNPVPAALPPEPTEQEADPVTAELTAALRAEGGIATADELGDLIGRTDPREMFAAVTAAAGSGALEFHETEPGSEELVLLSADCGGTTEQRRAAVARIAEWAVRSEDPLDEFHRVLGDLNPVRVPAHRLVGIAAFLRGTTPAGLL